MKTSGQKTNGPARRLIKLENPSGKDSSKRVRAGGGRKPKWGRIIILLLLLSFAICVLPELF